MEAERLVIRDILDTDFLEGLSALNEVGEIYSVKEYFKQLARYKHSLEVEYVHYENLEDELSMIEIKVEYDYLCSFINDLRRCEKSIRDQHSA